MNLFNITMTRRLFFYSSVSIFLEFNSLVLKIHIVVNVANGINMFQIMFCLTRLHLTFFFITYRGLIGWKSPSVVSDDFTQGAQTLHFTRSFVSARFLKIIEIKRNLLFFNIYTWLNSKQKASFTLTRLNKYLY